MSEADMKAYCDVCLVRDRVLGKDGIVDRLSKIEEKQVELNIKLTRLEWLVPVVTAALVALINWIPRIVDAARAANP
jgi:hypothetical protein